MSILYSAGLTAYPVTPPPTTEDIHTLYSNIYTQLKKQLTPNEFAIFITGSWLTNIQLALNSQQHYLLNELNQTEFIRKQLTPLHLPENIDRNLEKLGKHLQKEKYNNNDLNEMNNIISDIQNILS